jgi:hypothetical protein
MGKLLDRAKQAAKPIQKKSISASFTMQEVDRIDAVVNAMPAFRTRGDFVHDAVMDAVAEFEEHLGRK